MVGVDSGILMQKRIGEQQKNGGKEQSTGRAITRTDTKGNAKSYEPNAAL